MHGLLILCFVLLAVCSGALIESAAENLAEKSERFAAFWDRITADDYEE